MKRLLLIVATIGLLAFGLDQLADVTQTRPDVDVAGSHSAVNFGVSTKAYTGSLEEAGLALWAACAGTIPSIQTGEGLVSLGRGDFRVTVEPAIGRNANDRLRGCLRDATIDRVSGRVIDIVHHYPEGTAR